MLCLFFLAVSCTREEIGIDIPVDDDLVRIELFTRLNGFNTPVSRSLDDDAVGKTPWIIVFSSSDGTLTNAKYMEAARASLNANQKSYVELSPQANKSWVLVLANPQEKFYAGGTGYDFSIANFDAVLGGKTLTAATALLSAMPLSPGSAVNSPPFSGPTLPMSYLLELSGGINASTKIGTDTDPLEMVRAVAKITIKGAATGFTLLGIHSAYNFNNQSTLHNIDGIPSVATTLVDYLTSAPDSYDFVPVSSQVSEPLYMYEAKADGTNYPYVIIRANYGSDHCYYKLALVDDNKNLIDISRNYEYEFTITGVNSRGYITYEDAKLGNPVNMDLDYTVKIVDASAYEIVANNGYFLAVSNKACLIYNTANTNDEYVAFTLTTNCTHLFSSRDNYISTWNDALTITSGASIPTASTPNNTVSMDVKVRVNRNGDSGITLKLGDLEQRISVLTDDIIPAAGTTLKFYSYDVRGWYVFDYYLLSAELVEDRSWVEFRNSSNKTHASDYMQVEDGILDINVAAASSARNAELYLTTIKNPGYPQGDNENMPRRIKMIVYQSGS